MTPPVVTHRSLIYYRLIALWVLCEAMLGSIIFSLKIPVSGLVIGSCAIVCIKLIAWYVPAKGAIIRATLMVAVFKMMLSPQAPPAAYIAVFFQGAMGELLFWNRKYFRLCCLLLALLAMMESAFQRILVITIVYGNDLWTAVNIFLNRLTSTNHPADFSFFIVSGYVALHLVVGILVGVWTGVLPRRIQKMKGLQQQYQIETTGIDTSAPVTRRRRTRRLFLFITWIALMILYVQSFFHIGNPLLPSQETLRILVRSVIVVLTWYFFISPVLNQLLKRWLQQKKKQSGKQVQEVLSLLPSTQGLVFQSWQLTRNRKGWKRIILCCKIILANTFYTVET